jgi:hypothetical protein
MIPPHVRVRQRVTALIPLILALPFGSRLNVFTLHPPPFTLHPLR